MWDALTNEANEGELMMFLGYSFETAAVELLLLGAGFFAGMWFLNQMRGDK